MIDGSGQERPQQPPELTLRAILVAVSHAQQIAGLDAQPMIIVMVYHLETIYAVSSPVPVSPSASAIFLVFSNTD